MSLPARERGLKLIEKDKDMYEIAKDRIIKCTNKEE